MQIRKHTTTENTLAKAMLLQVFKNKKIQNILSEISSVLYFNVFLPFKKEVLSSTTLSLGMQNIINSWAMKHSKEDAALGALLPEITPEALSTTSSGRQMLMAAIEKQLSDEINLTNIENVISFIKTLDDMGFCYVENGLKKSNQQEFDLVKNMIFPTQEETDMRCRRPESVLAITYGIGTMPEEDLTEDKKIEGCLSGKAKYIVPTVEVRFENYLKQFDSHTTNQIESKFLEEKLTYYHIPLSVAERQPTTYYANRNRPWFEKLSRDKKQDSSLPLIASASSSTARLLITLQHIGAFNKSDGAFDLDKAQILANCLMGYFVFSGHHSYLEVTEIWNRLLDYIAINHPQQLPLSLIQNKFSDKSYFFDQTAEANLPYAKIGDYYSFIHTSYKDDVITEAESFINRKESMAIKSIHKIGIFNTTDQGQSSLIPNDVKYKC